MLYTCILRNHLRQLLQWALNDLGSDCFAYRSHMIINMINTLIAIFTKFHHFRSNNGSPSKNPDCQGLTSKRSYWWLFRWELLFIFCHERRFDVRVLRITPIICSNHYVRSSDLRPNIGRSCPRISDFFIMAEYLDWMMNLKLGLCWLMNSARIATC